MMMVTVSNNGTFGDSSYQYILFAEITVRPDQSRNVIKLQRVEFLPLIARKLRIWVHRLEQHGLVIANFIG